MIIYKILYLNGTFGDVKIFGGQWTKLHNDLKKDFYFKTEWKEFFKLYKIESTIFNLNCLEMFKGVVLTNSQFEELKKEVIK